MMNLAPIPNAGIVPARLEHEQIVRRALLHRKSARTLHEYEKAWRYFDTWCAQHGYSALPADAFIVSAYLADAARRNKKVSTLRQWSAAIGYKHRLAQCDDPTRAEGCKETLEGLAREYGTAQAKEAPITRDELAQMLLSASDDLRGARDRALLLVGFCGALRRSELVALEVRDIAFLDGDAVLTLRQSKTDQSKHGETICLPSDADARLNPVSALREWLFAAQLSEGKVFRKVDRWGQVWARGLTAPRVAETVKKYAALAGIDPQRVSGHSLRAGFITTAARRGMTAPQIATISRHKSMDVLQGYIRDAGKMQRDVIAAVLKGEETP